MQVGEALAREDLRAPVDALVFLGDNFTRTASRRTSSSRACA
jgi:hypothetical protein